MEKKQLVICLSLGILLIAAAAIFIYWILNGQKEEAAQEGMLVQHAYIQMADENEDAEEALCFWLGEDQI